MENKKIEQNIIVIPEYNNSENPRHKQDYLDFYTFMELANTKDIMTLSVNRMMERFQRYPAIFKYLCNTIGFKLKQDETELDLTNRFMERIYSDRDKGIIYKNEEYQYKGDKYINISINTSELKDLYDEYVTDIKEKYGKNGYLNQLYLPMDILKNSFIVADYAMVKVIESDIIKDDRYLWDIGDKLPPILMEDDEILQEIVNSVMVKVKDINEDSEDKYNNHERLHTLIKNIMRRAIVMIEDIKRDSIAEEITEEDIANKDINVIVSKLKTNHELMLYATGCFEVEEEELTPTMLIMAFSDISRPYMFNKIRTKTILTEVSCLDKEEYDEVLKRIFTNPTYTFIAIREAESSLMMGADFQDIREESDYRLECMINSELDRLNNIE